MSNLYLKNVILIGYKNFSKSTKVILQKNLNIIVGPSGCGKSNLFGAITWVLSDNESQKELIDTILFRGNEEVQKTDFAEVSLIYGDKEASSDDEIIIKRRLERNGNESFFVNNNQLSDFECLKKQLSKLHLPDLCLLDEFDKNKKHRKSSKIYSDIEFRSQGKQTLVVFYRKKNICKLSTVSLIGITFDEGTSKVHCMNNVL